MASATARRREPAAAASAPSGGTAAAAAADEDIAAIAKQISDQAEAIYQNWKSRGLAPADLITCHAATDTTKLGSMLKPHPSAGSKPSIELLAQAPTMDNNRLEKLVKNFVVEDKARLAAAQAQRNKPMPSSIQFALQKFEKNSVGTDERNKGKATPSFRTNNFTPVTSTSSTLPKQNSNAHNQKPAISQKPQISPKPRLGETIEMTLPAEISAAPGLQTWPLKNRVISTDTVKKTAAEVRSPDQQTHPQPYKSSTTTIEEVAREENRLLNALKNGIIVTEECPRTPGSTITTAVAANTSLSPVATSTTSSITKTQLQQQLKTTTVSTTISTTNDDRGTVSESNSNSIPSSVTRWGGLRSTRRPASGAEQQVPHPELTSSQKLHLRQAAAASANPVRPFLTRGSVAERVLIFERCPSDLLLDKRARSSATVSSKPQPPIKNHQLQAHHQQLRQLHPGAHTTLQRHVRAHRNVHIPRFHFPTGKPPPPGHLETVKSKVTAIFAGLSGERATREHFGQLTQACGLSLYWKTPFYLAVCQDKPSCTLDQLMTFWTSMTSTCHDAASRFVHILTRGGRRQWLAPEDFIPLVQDVVETHPGLTFLKEATEFHSRYVHTVIARIYYCVNRSWSGKVTVPELRRSNLLQVIQMLEEEEDINQITQYFSYEHFYVIYCKFWELDKDHDLFIDKQDLTRHNDHALSSRIIDRIFSGCVTRGGPRRRPRLQQQTSTGEAGPGVPEEVEEEEKMSYTEFVWFLLSEEDKQHPTAIEYWFRCMDLDGDGYLSMYELEYFYDEQMHRMEAIGIETLPFQDCLCQMLDMVKPRTSGKISLSDLKKCRMTPIFFDTFFNLEKYLDHEQRDPFASQRDHDYDGQEMSDWDRYAAEEYELLVAEEGGNDQQDSLSFDEGNEEDLLSQHLDVALDITDGADDLTDDSDEGSI